MSDNILVDASLRLISAALDEYTDWHSQAMRHVFYEQYSNDLPFPEMPRAITGLQELLKSKPDLKIGEIDRIFKATDALQEIVVQALRINGEGRILTYAQFSEFNQLYDDMLHRLHRIERSQYLSGLGYDGETGLRSGEVMFQELEREMERVARRGRTFSLVLSSLDDADKLRKDMQESFGALQRYIGTAVLYTIRTFDDAYHLEGDEYLVTLKHADLQGAQRFIARLRDYFTERPFKVGDKAIDFTLSFCVAEPVVGEDLHQFLDMMRRDLENRAEKENDALVYYEEESPLRRYMREQQGGR